MNKILLIILGWVLHIFMVELANISYTHRFGECVVKMHKKIYPELHPEGGHYCLTATRKGTLFENIVRYSPNLWKIYEEKIVQPKLSKAYEENNPKIKEEE